MKIVFKYEKEDLVKFIYAHFEWKLKRFYLLVKLLLFLLPLLIIIALTAKSPLISIKEALTISFFVVLTLIILKTKYLYSFVVSKEYKDYIGSSVCIEIEDDSTIHMQDNKGVTTFFPDSIQVILDFKGVFFLKPNNVLAIIIPYKRLENSDEIVSVVNKLAEKTGEVILIK